MEAATGGSFDRRLQPTRFLFQRRITLVRSTSSRISHATRALPVHAGSALRRSVGHARGICSACAPYGVPLASWPCSRSERSGRAPRSPVRESREPIVSEPRETVMLRGSTPDAFHPSHVSHACRRIGSRSRACSDEPSHRASDVDELLQCFNRPAGTSGVPPIPDLVTEASSAQPKPAVRKRLPSLESEVVLGPTRRWGPRPRSFDLFLGDRSPLGSTPRHHCHRHATFEGWVFLRVLASIEACPTREDGAGQVPSSAELAVSRSPRRPPQPLRIAATHFLPVSEGAVTGLPSIAGSSRAGQPEPQRPDGLYDREAREHALEIGRAHV